jgi:5-deoxy-5-amino-3-dehydroquinate synthase
MDRIDDDRVAEHRRVVAGYDLALRPPPDISFDDVRPLFSRDKKALTGTTFVLDGPSGPEVVSEVHDDVLAEAYRRLTT